MDGVPQAIMEVELQGQPRPVTELCPRCYQGPSEVGVCSLVEGQTYDALWHSLTAMMAIYNPVPRKQKDGEAFIKIIPD